MSSLVVAVRASVMTGDGAEETCEVLSQQVSALKISMNYRLSVIRVAPTNYGPAHYIIDS